MRRAPTETKNKGSNMNEIVKINKLVVIGWTGQRRAYLNTSEEEALARFKKSEDGWQDNPPVEIIDFDDSFGVYEVWALNDE